MVKSLFHLVKSILDPRRKIKTEEMDGNGSTVGIGRIGGFNQQ